MLREKDERERRAKRQRRSYSRSRSRSRSYSRSPRRLRSRSPRRRQSRSRSRSFSISRWVAKARLPSSPFLFTRPLPRTTLTQRNSRSASVEFEMVLIVGRARDRSRAVWGVPRLGTSPPDTRPRDEGDLRATGRPFVRLQGQWKTTIPRPSHLIPCFSFFGEILLVVYTLWLTYYLFILIVTTP
jgi:hypothetical protein